MIKDKTAVVLLQRTDSPTAFNLYTAHTAGLKWTSLTREASNRTASKIERID